MFRSLRRPMARTFIPLVVLMVLVSGCQSGAMRSTRVSAPATTPVAAVNAPREKAGASGVAVETRERLARGGQAHEMLARTAFGESRGFTTAGWSGVVLTPRDLSQGLVVGSEYVINRVEVHPLADGRLRVWAEIRNRANYPVFPEGACEFRPVADKTVAFATLPIIPPQGVIVASFESAGPQMDGYSLMVRGAR